MYECVCMQIFCICTFIHIYQHTQLHSHIHSYTRTHTRALSLSHTHTNAHGLACTHKLVRAHSLTIDSLFLWPHSMQCRRRGQTTGLSHTNTGRPKTNRCTCNSHGNRTHLARTSFAGVHISPEKSRPGVVRIHSRVNCAVKSVGPGMMRRRHSCIARGRNSWCGLRVVVAACPTRVCHPFNQQPTRVCHNFNHSRRPKKGSNVLRGKTFCAALQVHLVVGPAKRS
jgi:hypothetical protein